VEYTPQDGDGAVVATLVIILHLVLVKPIVRNRVSKLKYTQTKN